MIIAILTTLAALATGLLAGYAVGYMVGAQTEFARGYRRGLYMVDKVNEA